jgi:hypothetical protein
LCINRGLYPTGFPLPHPASSLHNSPIMAPIVVTGIKTGIPPHPKEADYPARLEWSIFAKNTHYVTLYVKALEKLMTLSQATSVPLSFFQISGIILIDYLLYSI